MVDNPEITMPHRHTVKCSLRGGGIEYETELAYDGIILYLNSAKSNGLSREELDEASEKVIRWLEVKFKRVIVDRS